MGARTEEGKAFHREGTVVTKAMAILIRVTKRR